MQIPNRTRNKNGRFRKLRSDKYKLRPDRILLDNKSVENKEIELGKDPNVIPSKHELIKNDQTITLKYYVVVVAYIKQSKYDK